MSFFHPSSLAPFAAVLLFSTLSAAGEILPSHPTPVSEQPDVFRNLTGFYDRLAADLKAGKPMVTTVHVALCDNESQGIIPVKNAKICDGDVPSKNLYWATSGGLHGFAKKHGWKRIYSKSDDTGTIMVTSVWKKKMFAGGELKNRGIKKRFDAYLVGLAYRGSQIEQAMIDYLHAVNTDEQLTININENLSIAYGGQSHINGYMGHDYFMDIYGADEQILMDELQGSSKLPKGTFALACVGHVYIRPAITRDNVYIFILNKQLAFPGAWTIGGIIDGVAGGNGGKRIHKIAARAFAVGMGRSSVGMYHAFAHGASVSD